MEECVAICHDKQVGMEVPLTTLWIERRPRALERGPRAAHATRELCQRERIQAGHDAPAESGAGWRGVV
jgi:hypothetical protein